MWKVPKQRRFCPRGFGVHHPPSTWMCSPNWKLSEPHTLGIFMKVSSPRHDRLLTLSPGPSPPRRMGGGAERSKLLILPCFFLRPAPIQEPTKSCLITTKNPPITQEILRGLGNLPQEMGQRSNMHFLFCHTGSYLFFS